MPEAYTVDLPTLHPNQAAIFENRGRYNVVRCGRRWGKTKMMVTLAANEAAHGGKVGLFTPEHKQLQEPYSELLWLLSKVKTEASKTAGMIKTNMGGQIDFWSLNDNELAGRGREYDLVMIDEAAFTKDTQMMGIWEKAITPTMLTRPGARVWVFSTPNGNNPDNFFWKLCRDEKMKEDFKEHYAPSASNPKVLPEEIDKWRRTYDPRVFDQECLAIFVDWGGHAFFKEENLLVEGRPVEYPTFCDCVYAVIDTAVKAGAEHDGTGVCYWALGTRVNADTWYGHPLVCLDYDYVKIEGAHLVDWIPSVFQRLEELARLCNARGGSVGVYIEDAQSGSILLQQCAHRGLAARPLPQDLTSAGKDARAINASAPVHQGHVKWSRYVFEKSMSYGGAYRNHMTGQVYDFHIGDKAAAKRADDLLDCFTYGVAIGLGTNKGYA